MALAHEPLPPLPPELAMDDSPLPDADLQQLWDAATELAADAAMDPGDAALQLADSDDGPSRRWWITDDGGAEWALRHVAEAEAELVRLRQQRDAWVERISQWFTQAAGKEQARRAFFVDHLERYAIAERERADRKTIKLPSGVLRTRPAPATVKVTDEAKVLLWAQEQGVLDEVAPPKRSVKLTPLREHAKAVEVVDWAQLVLSDGTVWEWMRNGVEAVYATEASTPRQVIHGHVCPQVGDGHYVVRREPLHVPDDPAGVVLQDDRADLPALVARVEPLASHLEVHGSDGGQVPGCYAEPAGVSASIALASDGQ